MGAGRDGWAGQGRRGSRPPTVLGKVLTVLQAFTVDETVLGFAELARRTELPKATLHRTLGDLVAHRLLERVDGRYRLSGLVFELGMRASVERTLLEVATPFLEDLYERTHETVHLGIREGHEVVYVAKLGGHRQVRSPSRLGGRMPLHATAIGKALLAHAPDAVVEEVLSSPLGRPAPRTVINVDRLRRQLRDIRTHGTAFEYEESAVGVACVAAPVVTADREATAAISIAGPAERFRPERHVAAVRSAASGVAGLLGRHLTTIDPGSDEQNHALGPGRPRSSG